MAQTRVVLDQAALRRFQTRKDGIVARDLFKRTKRVEGRAKRNAPVDTGRLRSAIVGNVDTKGDQLVGTVSANVNYALFVHEGTGVYGPTGSPITPKAGQFLVFTPKGASRPVFARSVQGQRPQPFLTDALPAAV